MNVTFITGNAHKAKYFAELIGQNIEHHQLNTPEIQSLDLAEIVEYKVRAAYAQFKKAVIVEDTGFIIHSFGRLPGPYIKWFLEEIGPDKICRLADVSNDRSATAGAAFAYYDGRQLKIFQSKFAGCVSMQPEGDGGFGWNAIFIPNGSSKTLGQMDDKAFKEYYIKIKPYEQIKEFLQTIDKG